MAKIQHCKKLFWIKLGTMLATKTGWLPGESRWRRTWRRYSPDGPDQLSPWSPSVGRCAPESGLSVALPPPLPAPVSCNTSPPDLALHTCDIVRIY